jgi:hypothetical protein
MRRAIVALLCVGVLIAGCGRGFDRDGSRDQLVADLVDGGLDPDVADCVVERFFAERTDDELRAFFERDELTEAERTEFVQLGVACGATA